MMRSSVDLPAPFRPSTPIFAPGKKDREMSLRICRLGGTTLPTRFIVKTYCAISVPNAWRGRRRGSMPAPGRMGDYATSRGPALVVGTGHTDVIDDRTSLV